MKTVVIRDANGCWDFGSRAKLLDQQGVAIHLLVGEGRRPPPPSASGSIPWSHESAYAPGAWPACSPSNCRSSGRFGGLCVECEGSLLTSVSSSQGSSGREWSAVGAARAHQTSRTTRSIR